MIGVNLLGVAYGVQAFVPRMLKQGRPAVVVNTASMAGLVAVGQDGAVQRVEVRRRGDDRGARRRAAAEGHRVQRDLPGHHRHEHHPHGDHARRAGRASASRRSTSTASAARRPTWWPRPWSTRCASAS